LLNVEGKSAVTQGRNLEILNIVKWGAHGQDEWNVTWGSKLPGVSRDSFLVRDSLSGGGGSRYEARREAGREGVGHSGWSLHKRGAKRLGLRGLLGDSGLGQVKGEKRDATRRFKSEEGQGQELEVCGQKGWGATGQEAAN